MKGKSGDYQSFQRKEHHSTDVFEPHHLSCGQRRHSWRSENGNPNDGAFTWPHFGANDRISEYPKGFLVSCSTSFRNDVPSFIRLMRKDATLMNFGTEGTPRWLRVEERRNLEDDPLVQRKETWLSLPGDGGRGR
jgi:hypothetical protein